MCSLGTAVTLRQARSCWIFAIADKRLRLGTLSRIQSFSESEAPGTVLSWDAPPAKQPPDAAASYHHEQNRQCDCSRKHCNDCCKRKDVHSAILKCEKHAFPSADKMGLLLVVLPW